MNNYRLVSLDALRGATVAGMLLVNNPGDWNHVYPPLRHAAWHGWTLADLVFPFFLWVVGFALVFSIARRRQRGETQGAILAHLGNRSILLFALGMVLAGFPFGLAFDHVFSMDTIRIPGVLQRIALCSLLAAPLVLYTRATTWAAWVVLLLGGYWLLMTLVPVPGFGPGVLEPRGNLAWFLDATLLAGHTWTRAPASGFDPEGLLSTLPALATTLLGALAGHLHRGTATPLPRMLTTGVGLLGLGLMGDHWFPINKNLWTSSYALFMAGLGQVVFCGIHWLMAIRGFQGWARPLVILGQNALTLFFLAGLLGRLLHLIKVPCTDGRTVAIKTCTFQQFFLPHLEPLHASLLYAIVFTLSMYGIAHTIHRWQGAP